MKISLGEVKQLIFLEVHIYPLGQMHSILWEKRAILWEVIDYPLGKPHSILGEKNMAILW